MSELGPRLARWAPPTALALFTVGGVLWHGADALRIAAAGITVLAGLLLRPGNRLLVPATVVAGIGAAVVCYGSASNVGWFALVVLAGWTAVVANAAIWAPFWAAALVLFGLQSLTTEPDPGWAAWIAGATFATFCCRLGRREHDLADQLRLAQVGLAERAKAEERNRIAREVHDVVAHSLTVSLLHISSARLALDDDPADAARALNEAERVGRAALTEVRQAVGLLPSRGTGSPHAPLPDAGRIPALVDSFRGAGAAVTFSVTGDVADLPATTGLAIYRILQEALTNSVRHAPGAATTAQLTSTDALVSLTVDTAAAARSATATATATVVGGTPGSLGAGAGAGAGLGLHSMRQRAEALGGTCAAGPRGAGWRIHAEIPLAAPTGRLAAEPSPPTDVNVLATP
jgi:signal transduction histidine kinase